MTAGQLGLGLGPQAGHPMPPHAPRSETSREAARRIAAGAGTLRARYLRLLMRAGERGLTDHEAARMLHCSLTTVQPRRAELLDEGVRVEAAPHHRDSPYGRPCVCWRLEEEGA